MGAAKNIFAEIPAQLPQELTERIAAGRRVVIERIISRGHASPPGFWYDQPRSEWVLLLCGRAGLRFEDRRRLTVLGPGDHIEIPAHCRHRVEWTDAHADTVWLAVFFDALTR